MRTTNKIPIPDIKQEEICDSLVDLKYKKRVIEKSLKYQTTLADLNALYEEEKEEMSNDDEYKSHMNKMYSERFSNQNYEAYKYYKKIRESQTYCPYCNIISHSVKQLDHYLPKSIFPVYSVTAVNLVPICSDCNDYKKAYFSTEKQGVLLHPYFDNLAKHSFDFIKCEIIENEKIGFKFYIEKLYEWSEDDYHRVCLHFEKLKLNDLYRTDFEGNFTAFCYEIKDVYNDLGVDEAKKCVERRMNSYINSSISPWLYAGYNAIYKSDWFFEYYLYYLSSK